MERTIRFRGKRITDGEWIYGDFFRNRGLAFIAEDGVVENPLASWKDYNVNPDTVGQFTGLCDCDDKEIYEGDIVEFTYKKLNECGSAFSTTQKVIGEIATDEYGNHYISSYNLAYHISNIIGGKAKVIGNIYDNPELLKGGEK